MKQVIILREDINMSRGKEIAQACHASLGAYKKADSDKVSQWESEGSKKIVVLAGERNLEDLYSKLQTMDITTYMVKDAGKTELEPGTLTALGVGPGKESEIDSVTAELELVG